MLTASEDSFSFASFEEKFQDLQSAFYLSDPQNIVYILRQGPDEFILTDTINTNISSSNQSRFINGGSGNKGPKAALSLFQCIHAVKERLRQGAVIELWAVPNSSSSSNCAADRRESLGGGGKKPVWIATGSPGQPDDIFEALFTPQKEEYQAGMTDFSVESTVIPVIAIIDVYYSNDSGGGSDLSVAAAAINTLNYGMTVVEDLNLVAGLQPFLMQCGAREVLVLSTAGKTELQVIQEELHEIRWRHVNFKQFTNGLQRMESSLVNSQYPLPAHIGEPLKKVLSCVPSLVKLHTTQLLRCSTWQPNSWMRLDPLVLRSLHIVPDGSSADAIDPLHMAYSRETTTTASSLYALLSNACLGGSGRRCLEAWLRRPLMDPKEILCRQACIRAFAEEPLLQKSLAEGPLRPGCIPDMPRCVKKILRKPALIDLVSAWQGFREISGLTDILSTAPMCFMSMHQELVELQRSFEPYCAMMSQMVSLEDEQDEENSEDEADDNDEDEENNNEEEPLQSISTRSKATTSKVYQIKPEYDPLLGQLRDERMRWRGCAPLPTALMKPSCNRVPKMEIPKMESAGLYQAPQVSYQTPPLAHP